MSHQQERRRVPRAAVPLPKLDPQQEALRLAFDELADPAELRRALLVYGTAGALAAPGARARTPRARDLH